MNNVTKWIIAGTLVLAMHTLSFSQLTITEADVSAAITNARQTAYGVRFDSPKSLDLGLATSGQSWNFSTLLAGTDTVRDTTIQDYIPPTGLPGAVQFPTATGAVKIDISSSFAGAQLTLVTYLHLESTGFYGLGSAFKEVIPPFIDTLIITKTIPMALYLPLPLTVGTNRTSRDTIINDPILSVHARAFDADGHGTLTFPDGASRKVIRMVTDDIAESYLAGDPISHYHSRTISFIAKDGSIMTFDVLDTAYTTGTTLVWRVSYEKKTGAVGVQIIAAGVPEGFNLSQNYPNPFNPSTTVTFSIPKKEQVSLKVYNLLGSEVATLVDQELAPGGYTADFNAANLPSGMYYYRMTAGDVVQVKKMSLIK